MIQNNLPVHTLASGLNFPEGPLFVEDGSLWLVEKDAGNLIHYQNGQIERFYVGGLPNGLALDGEGMLWYCDAGNNSICRFNPISKLSNTVCTHVANEALLMPNDLAFDSYGNLVFTCPGADLHTSKGYVCCWSPDGVLSKIATGMDYPNGLAFSKDGKHLYIAETGTTKIYEGRWDGLHKIWEAVQAVIETGGSVGPDGMAFDEAGNLYIAVYGAAAINVYNNQKELFEVISLAASNPTNCAFDPYGKLGLVITEAESGSLLHIPLPYKGIM